MATLGGESQPFPAAALAAATAGVGGGGGSLGLQAPLNRGLERALEEAAHSGGLNLSGRKLKEFPRSAAALSHDLSDTVRADLSKNRLTEVPTELCHFVSLETLNLYHNCIKIIPDAIVNLQMLTYLNLSRNQLSSLPACLCGLPLKVLIASNNKLGSLPEEIGQLKQLMELDVSCNEITALPQQIGQLKSLKELNVRRNYLEVLPQELVQLPLVKFDFSCNKVLVIPICFRKMVQLQVLLLENNPLQSPPAQICTKGKVHIFKYLTVQACQIKTADSLYLNAIEQQHLPQPVEESIDDIYPSKKDSDSGVGSDNGDKRLSATEPSDEDTISFNVPMSDIVEEDQVVKEDSGHHANSRKVEFHQGSSHLIVNDKSRETGNQFNESDTLTTEFMSYIKSRAAECDELLRIEEDTQWQTDEIINLSEEQTIDIAMIEQLREAVDLLQDPNRLSMDISESSGVNLYPMEPATALEFQESTVNGQMQMEMSSLGQSSISSDTQSEELFIVQRENAEEELEFQRRRELIMEKAKSEVRTCEQGEKWSLSQNDLIVWNTSGQTSHNENKDKSPTMSPTTNTTIPFGLKPRSADPSLSLPPISFNTLTQAQTWDNFSYSIPSEGDSDNVFLRPQRNLESIDPQFTIRRKMEQMREERELVEQLRENIETRLKICLPEDLGSALMDGVVLCHLVNHVRPRSVGSIHVPSPAVPKLSMAKCRRNVENFLDACRKLGIPEEKLCLPHHILEEKGLVKVSITVQALLDVTTVKQALFT
ncbi:leucine-rich repeat and calponin homology domain-containing protein 1 isoform X1 [Aquila chrysaetos chrysaetos]|uniref:leucine-rich repeat and calponin homology domain-containing protein 1 isoform X1 n=1 Tax=Aquila chrysaetos chrysaetos TaxID=223781 RepID=UPI001176FF61|nr:leucine-rich repeat and calponin homology domain-containing protein 1 isoform X1 [Aquila chrysaetos chrysaetos]